MIDNNNTIWLIWGIILAILLFFPVLIAFIMGVIVPFNETRDFIKMEMNRASGRKYRYWKKELRNLYLSHIPIVRWFVRKRH